MNSLHSSAGSRAAAAAYGGGGGGRNQYSTMPIMGGGGGNVDKMVLEAGVNHDSAAAGISYYQTTTLSTFSKRGTELHNTSRMQGNV